MSPGDIFDISLDGAGQVQGYCATGYVDDGDIAVLISNQKHIAIIDWRSVGARITGGEAFLNSLKECGRNIGKIKALAWDKISGSITLETLQVLMEKSRCEGVLAGRRELQDSIKTALGME